MKTPIKAPNFEPREARNPNPFRLYEPPVLDTQRALVRYVLMWTTIGAAFVLNPPAGALIGAAFVCADKADQAAGHINFWEAMK